MGERERRLQSILHYNRRKGEREREKKAYLNVRYVAGRNGRGRLLLFVV